MTINDNKTAAKHLLKTFILKTNVKLKKFQIKVMSRKCHEGKHSKSKILELYCNILSLIKGVSLNMNNLDPIDKLKRETPKNVWTMKRITSEEANFIWSQIDFI